MGSAFFSKILLICNLGYLIDYLNLIEISGSTLVVKDLRTNF